MKSVISFRQYTRYQTRIAADELFLYYALQGETHLEMENKRYVLKSGDLFAVNPLEVHRVHLISGILVQASIGSQMLGLGMDSGSRRYIQLSSLQEHTSAIAHMQKMMQTILCIDPEQGQGFFERERLCYELIEYLFRYFSLNTRSVSSVLERKQQIEAYISMHYKEELSLESIARAFGLSPAYFSKYFKDTFGISFLKYLARYRCEMSLSMLENTDEIILNTALEYGFANVNAYISTFKECYGQTPAQYRKSRCKEMLEESIGIGEVRRLLEKEEAGKGPEDSCIRAELKEDEPDLNPYWFSLINLGSINQLSSSRDLEMMKNLLEILPFQNTRLFLDMADEDWSRSFYEIQSVLDPITSMHIKPWIVLSFRDLMQKTKQSGSNLEILDYFEAFLTYFTNRYGVKLVEEWTFELYYNSGFQEEDSENYDSLCRALNECLEKHALKQGIAGPGLQLEYEAGNLIAFLEQNTQIRHITISLSAISFEHKNGEVHMNRKTSHDSFLDDYNKAWQIVHNWQNEAEKAKRPFCPAAKITPVEWQDSVFALDLLNDTSWRSARLVQAYLLGYEKMPALPISIPFDLLEQNRGLFCHDPGLITDQDIPKPAWHALTFLKQLDNKVMFHNPDMIITSSGDCYVELVLQNCQPLSYQYYLDEGQQDPARLEEYFESSNPRTFKIRLDGMKNAHYLIKEKAVGPEEGNAYARWRKFNYPSASFVGPREIECLKAAAIPPITGHTATVKDHTLELTITLQPNEIRHLHVVYEGGTPGR